MQTHLSLVNVASQIPSGSPERAIADKLETHFLNELLKSSGVGDVPSEFGGGTGEEQFGTFLRRAYAEEMSKAGGLGLSEQIARALIAAEQ